jgi:hypothetical protein
MSKSKSAKKSSVPSNETLDTQIQMTEQEFSSMLLNALRHNDEVKASIANIVRNREDDVYSAVVKCLRQGHSDITSSIGNQYQIPWFSNLLMFTVNETVEPLKSLLIKDNSFNLTVAKIVNSRIRHDRYNILNEIGESELEVSATAVPKLSKDLSKNQLAALDSLMTRKYGERWFKDRRTHPSNVPSNVELQCCILSCFYESHSEMLELVESEIARADDRRTGVSVDADVLETFFASAEGFRSLAWAEVEGKFTLARDRLQRKLRSQRHREKVKEDKMFASDDPDDDKPGSSTAMVENESGSSQTLPINAELEENSSLAPVKSVARCVKEFLILVKTLSDPSKRTSAKFSGLETLFEEYAGDLESRTGFKIVNQDANVCFMLGLLDVISELLPEDLTLRARLEKLKKGLSAQGAVVVVEPLTLDKTRRTQIQKVILEQQEVVTEFLKRWIDDDERDVVISSDQLEARARSVADEGDQIIRELDEVPNALTRRDVQWILGRMSLWYCWSCVLSTTCYKGSSLLRIGERVKVVDGISF